METRKVKICPFCGHHSHRLAYSTVDVRCEDGERVVNDIWQMECEYCGARGPTECTPRSAMDSWNMLHRQPPHDGDPVEEDFTFDEESIKKGKMPYGKED